MSFLDYSIHPFSTLALFRFSLSLRKPQKQLGIFVPFTEKMLQLLGLLKIGLSSSNMVTSTWMMRFALDELLSWMKII